MEEISKTIDFTNLTFEVDPGVHCFNPSIAHWRGNLFLCCYRAFVRYPNQQKTKQILDPELDPNHPWLGGDQSVTWWNTVLGGDGTGFCILQIDPPPSFSVKNVKRLNDGESIFDLSFSNNSSSNNSSSNSSSSNSFSNYSSLNYSKTNWTKLNGVDARLLHLKDDFFLLSYNTNVYSNQVHIKQGINCVSGCFMIATRLIRLNTKTGELGIFRENIICPSISNPVEKNWSFFFSNDNKLFFSYGLAPSHQVYPARVNFENGKINCHFSSLE